MINIFGHKFKTSHLFMPFMALVTALILPFSYYVATSNQDTRSNAQGAYFTFVVEPSVGADIYFDPGSTTLTNDTPIKIKANYPSNDVVFIKAVATFDPTKIHLTSEITTNPVFTTTVSKTTMATANANGKIEIVIASSPADAPQRGNFDIATFNISPVAGVTTGSTSIDFVPAEMQIVDNTTQVLSLTPGNLIINFNSAGGTPVPTLPPTGNSNASVFFDPSTVNVVGDTPVNIKANYPNNIAFTKTVFTFDPSVIQLTSEITTNPAFSTTVSKTTMAAANTSGRVEIVIAAAPADTLSTGTFDIGSFTIAPATGVTDATTSINLVPADMQFVDEATQALSITPGNLTVNIGAGGPTAPVPTNGQNPGPTTDPNVTQEPGGNPNPTKNPGDDDNDDNDSNEDKHKQEDHKNIPAVIRKKIGDFNNDGKVTFKDLFDWIKSLFRRHRTNK